MVIEGVLHRGGDDAGLSQRAAQCLFPASCLFVSFFRHRQNRSKWASETFRKTDLDRVGPGSPMGRRDAGCDGGIHETRTVDMKRELMVATNFNHFRKVFFRPDAAAAAIGCIFHDNDATSREMRVVDSQGSVHIFAAKKTAGSTQGHHLRARNHGGRATFIMVHMRRFMTEDFVSRSGVQGERNLVGKRGARDKKCFFLAQKQRHIAFECRSGWIFSLLFIAYSGLGHRLQHFSCGTRGGIADEVDREREVLHRNIQLFRSSSQRLKSPCDSPRSVLSANKIYRVVHFRLPGPEYHHIV